MTLVHQTDIDLPAHRGPGGFDHAAIHRASARLYIAHTANDALEVLDCATDRYLHVIPHLIGVASALVSDASKGVFTSNGGHLRPRRRSAPGESRGWSPSQQPGV